MNWFRLHNDFADSTQRVRKHRVKLKLDETLHGRFRNAPRTDTDIGPYDMEVTSCQHV